MQKARKITGLLLALALVATVVALAGCSSSTPSTPSTTPETSSAPAPADLKLVNPGVLTIGSDTAFPPFESMNGDVAEGFDVDLMAAIAKELGLEVKFTDRDFDTLIPTLKAGGKFDVIASGMTITD